MRFKIAIDQIMKTVIIAFMISSFFYFILISSTFAQDIVKKFKWDIDGRKYPSQWEYASRDPDNILPHFDGVRGDKIAGVALLNLGFSEPILAIKKFDSGSCGLPTIFVFKEKKSRGKVLLDLCAMDITISPIKNKGINNLIMTDATRQTEWQWNGNTWTPISTVQRPSK